MSGRGGRGGKYKPPSGGRAFLMRSAQECGLDSNNLRSVHDTLRTELFPDIKLHSSGDNQLLILAEREEEARAQAQAQGMAQGGVVGASSKPKQLSGVKRSAQTFLLITKGREIHHRVQNSVFYVRPTKDVPDVIRYSDSTRPPPKIDASAVLSNCLGGRKVTKMGRYVPEELVSGQEVMRNSGQSRTNKGGKFNLNHLEAEEKKRRRLGSMDQGESGDEEYEKIEQQDEDEPDGEDYAKNYYESEGDDDFDENGEATF